jgi:hypothetical protein
MTVAPTWAVCLAGAALNAGVILAAGSWFESTGVPPAPTTACAGFFQQRASEKATEVDRKGAPSTAVGPTGETRPGLDCSGLPCGTPPDDWRPQPCADRP